VTLLFAALLGIVQGLTEFLPISSSAHLILARAFFGWDADAFGLAFDVACHVGTLAAVVVYFWTDLWAMAKALPRVWSDDPHARHTRLIAAGTLPVIVVGVLFADAIETWLRTPAVAGGTLALGAAGLLLAERIGRRARGEESVGMGEALVLGVAQASALVPGISRSGATITIGMLFGLRRDAAARFSFLLGVPAILAAAAKEGLVVLQTGLSADAAALFFVGMVSSAVVGYLTIKYFLRYLASHRLTVFALYRLALSAAVVVWLLTRQVS
jgi:undecaprenyl-diphosphatase